MKISFIFKVSFKLFISIQFLKNIVIGYLIYLISLWVYRCEWNSYTKDSPKAIELERNNIIFLFQKRSSNINLFVAKLFNSSMCLFVSTRGGYRIFISRGGGQNSTLATKYLCFSEFTKNCLAPYRKNAMGPRPFFFSFIYK